MIRGGSYHGIFDLDYGILRFEGAGCRGILGNGDNNVHLSISGLARK